jgi:hypothetical protein
MYRTTLYCPAVHMFVAQYPCSSSAQYFTHLPIASVRHTWTVFCMVRNFRMLYLHSTLVQYFWMVHLQSSPALCAWSVLWYGTPIQNFCMVLLHSTPVWNFCMVQLHSAPVHCFCLEHLHPCCVLLCGTGTPVKYFRKVHLQSTAVYCILHRYSTSALHACAQLLYGTPAPLYGFFCVVHQEERYLLLEQYVNVVIPFLTKSGV